MPLNKETKPNLVSFSGYITEFFFGGVMCIFQVQSFFYLYIAYR